MFLKHIWRFYLIGILTRMMYAMIPVPAARKCMRNRFRPNPDLFGALFIIFGTIISIFLTGNSFEYSHGRYVLDFSYFRLAAIFLFIYVITVGTLVWFSLEMFVNTVNRYQGRDHVIIIILLTF